MTIDMNDQAAREQVEAAAYAMSVTPVALTSAMQGAMEADKTRAKLEVELSGEWADLTKYMQAGGERTLEAVTLGPTRPRKTRKELARIPGPNRVIRQRALRARVLVLPQRLEITGGTGNWMVNLCRSGTAQAAADRAVRARTSMRKDAHHPNERLRTFGMRVELDADGLPVLIGGTARQRTCYHKALRRYLVSEGLR